MGVPVEDLEQFMAWEDKILHQTGVGGEANAARLEDMTHVMGYLSGLIQQRRENRDPDAVAAADVADVSGPRTERTGSA